jgi:tRNA U55 pseudouridine synthase TruB
VTVHSLDVTDFDATSSTFGLRVRCGGGTYVRTLIVDLGRAVGSAAHMTALVRTQVGPFACEGTGADGVSVMRPVREGQFGEAACYYAAMDEAAAVLEAEAQRGAGADEGGAAWCPPTDEKSEEWNGRW